MNLYYVIVLWKFFVYCDILRLDKISKILSFYLKMLDSGMGTYNTCPSVTFISVRDCRSYREFKVIMNISALIPPYICIKMDPNDIFIIIYIKLEKALLM